MSGPSSTPSLTPSRSVSPAPVVVQPDHFYGFDNVHHSPNTHGRTYFDPKDDPLAQRGIPVFKPTMEEFQDFEGYMNSIEAWGMRSGIVKVIPPAEWTNALPSFKSNLAKVSLKNPIEQQMVGRAGLFRQQNVEKRKTMSMRDWAELCARDEFRAPSANGTGIYHPRGEGRTKSSRKARQKFNLQESTTPRDVTPFTSHNYDRDDPMFQDGISNAVRDFLQQEDLPTLGSTPAPEDHGPKKKGRRVPTREEKEASMAEKTAQDAAFLESFDVKTSWLPPNTRPDDYTPEFCKELERQYWRNCGLGKPAWYGADMQGTLFGEADTCWNVGHLPSALSRLLPSSEKGLPGVNTPYLYFGMWRATFAWHVEDMDLFSINYIHFGAPKFWYAVPQGRASALEQTFRNYFPKDASSCAQFLRHKSFFASPSVLSQSSCRPNTLVQRAGEFVITYPRGYHAGFNLGLNCAESVNFALESWIELGRKAKACDCVDFSVRIDVDQLLLDRERERLEQSQATQDTVAMDNRKPKPRKRKHEESTTDPKGKKLKVTKEKGTHVAAMLKPSLPKLSITLKIGSTLKETFPCCLCVSEDMDGLLPVYDTMSTASMPKMAHEHCASVVPETWVDDYEVDHPSSGTSLHKTRAVFGVDGIVKDRWNLKCSACLKPRHKAHGAPIQCTKGKCSKAFHIMCARDGAEQGISYEILHEVEKEVILVQSADGNADSNPSTSNPEVLKTIRKLDVQLLCPQHNPAVIEAKKAHKQDKIRNELHLLPVMSRIKVRVSSGVFEVSLLRVIDETKSVEVLWDRGVKREFKWGAIVFGNTDRAVGQKPTEPSADTSSLSSQAVVNFGDVPSGSNSPLPVPVSVSTHPSTVVQPTGLPYAPPQINPYSAGAYSYQYQSHVSPYPYAGYLPQGLPIYTPPGFVPDPSHYRASLQWQQPYQGPAHPLQRPEEGPAET
ncbi:JmjC-domain-containing protein [Thelephora ganbajun]|uniref:JmjC-domain-containing protein n=1 Tax=Thelephora ganbajun TaxID=370292 RepID=A0ACB6ZMG9_THEGA|nr:JmjC-domain-containing protein [Thelephora ganbajun]